MSGGCHGTTLAPAARSIAAASRTARRTAGLGVNAPSSSYTATRSPATSTARWFPSGIGGSRLLCEVPVIVRKPSATSSTERANTPTWLTIAR
jgi:hypothetical protein